MKWIVLLSLVLVSGCSSKSEQPGSAPLGVTNSPSSPVPSPSEPAVSSAPSAREVRADKMDAEVKAVFDAWLTAQNQNDFASYGDFYNNYSFKGTKRTTNSPTRRMQKTEWLKDRKRMFGKNPVVAADNVIIRNWLRPSSRFKENISEVRFVQRWKTKSYADHGIKIMLFWRDDAGTQHIIYEDLINAEPGWDGDIDASVAKTKIPEISSPQQALATLESFSFTGANYQRVLGSIEASEQTVIALALAILDGGNFRCTDVVYARACGMGLVDYKALDLDATFDNGCLRRRLAKWALEQLSPELLKGREHILIALVDTGITSKDELTKLGVEPFELETLDAPSDAVLENALVLARKVSDDAWLQTIAKTRNYHSKVTSIENISDSTLQARLYLQQNFSRAIEYFVVGAGARINARDDGWKIEYSALLKATRKKVDWEVRMTSLTELRKVAENRKDLTDEILVAVKGMEKPSCREDMFAREIRFDFGGDEAALPKRTKSSSDAENEYHLCLLVHASSTKERSFKELAAMIPKKGIVLTHINEDQGGFDELNTTEKHLLKDSESIVKWYGDWQELSWGKGTDGGPVLHSVTLMTVSSDCGC